MPMQAAATATRMRNGAMTRVSCTVSSNLPGTAAKSPASSRTSGWAKTMASDHEHAGDDDQRVHDGVAQPPGALAALERERAG